MGYCPTVQIDERPMSHETLSQERRGVLNCFAQSSMSGLGASPLYSPHLNEEVPSPNPQSEVQENHRVTETSSIASSQASPASGIRTRVWCPNCGAGFVQKQGLNRHKSDKHSPPNVCYLCGIFKWPTSREYLFTKHLERHHSEVLPTDGSHRPGDKRRTAPRRHKPYS